MHPVTNDCIQFMKFGSSRLSSPLRKSRIFDSGVFGASARPKNNRFCCMDLAFNSEISFSKVSHFPPKFAASDLRFHSPVINVKFLCLAFRSQLYCHQTCCLYFDRIFEPLLTYSSLKCVYCLIIVYNTAFLIQMWSILTRCTIALAIHLGLGLDRGCELKLGTVWPTPVIPVFIMAEECLPCVFVVLDFEFFAIFK